MNQIECPENAFSSLKQWTSLNDIRCLLWLASLIPGDILEIGCNNGQTLLAFATQFPNRKCYGVDWSLNPKLTGPLKSETPILVGSLVRTVPNITLFNCDSKTLKYPDGLGFIFIDADHSVEGISTDSKNAIDYFKGGPGMIAWHDYQSQCYPSVTTYVDWLSDSGRVVFHVKGTSIAVLILNLLDHLSGLFRVKSNG